MNAASPIIVPAGEGRTLHAFGEEVIVHLDGAQTGGAACVWTEITPPGVGPPLHYHEREDEWFYVEEGRVAFFCNDSWQEVGPGGAVFVPRNFVHRFENVGSHPSRMRITTTPAGFEVFFAKCADEFKKPGGPDMTRILAIAAEHGIHFIHQES